MEASPSLLAVSSAATMKPSSSTPMCSLRHSRRFLDALYLCTFHSPEPRILSPVESTIVTSPRLLRPRSYSLQFRDSVLRLVLAVDSARLACGHGIAPRPPSMNGRDPEPMLPSGPKSIHAPTPRRAERNRRQRVGLLRPAPDVFDEVEPLDELHGEEPAVGVGLELVELDQVRVIEVGDRPKFSLEAVDGDRIALVERLQSDLGLQLLVEDPLDVARGPRAQAATHLVALGALEFVRVQHAHAMSVLLRKSSSRRSLSAW